MTADRVAAGLVRRSMDAAERSKAAAAAADGGVEKEEDVGGEDAGAEEETSEAVGQEEGEEEGRGKGARQRRRTLERDELGVRGGQGNEKSGGVAREERASQSVAV